MSNCYGDHCVEDLLTPSHSAVKLPSCVSRDFTQHKVGIEPLGDTKTTITVCLLRVWFFVEVMCLVMTQNWSECCPHSLFARLCRICLQWSSVCLVQNTCTYLKYLSIL